MSVVTASLIATFVVAQPIPSPGLKVVTHGSDHAGSGTVASPLTLRTDCAGSAVLKFNGTGWACGSDNVNPGTVTSVGSGSGISGGPITSSGNLSIDPTYTQRRVSGTCATPNAITTVNQDGTVSCSTGVVSASSLTSGRSVRATGTLTLGVGAWTDDGANASANGTTTVQQFISTQISPTAITGATNDWNPTGLTTATTILVTSSSSTILLNGIVGGVNGRKLVIVNHDSAQNLIVRNENAGSTTTNRIVTNYGDDILLGPGLDSSVTLEYWASRWHVTAINTFTPPGMSFQGQVTVGGQITLNSANGNITAAGSTIEGSLLVGGGGNFANYIGGNGAVPTTGCSYFTAGPATCYFNNTSDSGGTGNFRSLEIDDGKGSGGTGGSHYIGFFDGSTRTATFNNASITGTWISNFPKIIGPFTLGTSQNNYNPTGFAGSMVVRAVPTANIHITGFAAQADGYTFTFLNSDTVGWGITFDHESGSSTITNRLEMPDQQDAWTMYAGCSAMFQYNAGIGATTPGRWQVLAWSCDSLPRVTATNATLTSIFLGPVSIPNVSGSLSVSGNFSTTGGGSYINSNAALYAFGGTTELYNNSLVFSETTNAAATGYINNVGYAEGVTQFRNLEIDDGKGSGASHSIMTTTGSSRAATFSGDVTVNGTLSTGVVSIPEFADPTQFDDSVEFDNGFNAAQPNVSPIFNDQPTGAGGSYTGNHIEGADDWMNGLPNLTTNVPIGSGYVLTTASAGGGTSGIAAHVNTSGRPGVVALSAGTSTAGGLAQIMSDPNALTFSEGNWTYQWIGNWPTLSGTVTTGPAYTSVIGFADAAFNPTDGCGFLYDATNSSSGGANSGKVQNLECYCASNGTRTYFLIAGSGNSNESFPLGTIAVVAGTFYNLSVKMTGTTRAEFYNGVTKVCDINTNVPSGTTRATGFGFAFESQSASGAAARTMETDWTKWSVALTSTRSP